MAANEMSFNQISTVLNAIHAQATGTQVPAAVDTYGFVTQAQAVLKTGYDPIMSAVSQVLSRTIFSIRPYSAKFRGMMVSPERYGNHVRKINIADKAWTNDDRNTLTDGNSVDQQVVNVPNVVQTNFYGENVFQKSYTIFRDQLDVAFSSPEELTRFVTLVTSNANDMLEQSREELARMLVANYIGAKYVTTSNNMEGAEGCIHLLTEYNAQCGLTGDEALTATTVYQPANFKPFMQWVYARIASLCALLTERSARFHLNLTLSGVDKTLMRHTPYERQRVYLYAPARFQSEAQVLADTFHDNYLRLADTETVNFWQNITNPGKILVHPNWLGTDGTVGHTTQDVEISNIFGVVMDEETTGFTPVNQWQAPAPFNARGGYTTVWMHETQRHWTDMTENGFVLLLD